MQWLSFRTSSGLNLIWLLHPLTNILSTSYHLMLKQSSQKSMGLMWDMPIWIKSTLFRYILWAHTYICSTNSNLWSIYLNHDSRRLVLHLSNTNISSGKHKMSIARLKTRFCCTNCEKWEFILPIISKFIQFSSHLWLLRQYPIFLSWSWRS